MNMKNQNQDQDYMILGIKERILGIEKKKNKKINVFVGLWRWNLEVCV